MPSCLCVSLLKQIRNAQHWQLPSHFNSTHTKTFQTDILIRNYFNSFFISLLFSAMLLRIMFSCLVVNNYLHTKKNFPFSKMKWTRLYILTSKMYENFSIARKRRGGTVESHWLSMHDRKIMEYLQLTEQYSWYSVDLIDDYRNVVV